MRRSLLLFFTPFIIFTIGSYILSVKGCDSIMQAQAVKEIPFSHKTHVENYGISDCTVCHGYENNGRFMGIPAVGVCTSCHARDGVTTTTDKSIPRKKSMFDNYADGDRPWTAYAKQPDLVYFSHKVVLDAEYPDGTKKARCVSCHGDKAGSVNTSLIKGKMPMGPCMDCHTALNISNQCAVCHD